MELLLKAAFERDVDLVLARAFYEKNRTAQLDAVNRLNRLAIKTAEKAQLLTEADA